MLKHNQDGTVGGLGLSLGISIVLLIAAIVFGVWAFGSREDYKNHTDQKVAAAVTAAKQQESKLKNAQFAQAEKYPLRTYNGPEAYGSLVVKYPKTWSGAVDDTGDNTDTPVDGYFYPNIVPAIDNDDSDSTNVSFALRVQVLNQTYASTLQDLSSLQQDAQTPVTITPYALPKVPKVVGVELNGALPNQKTGLMVVLPLRSETLEAWTEGSLFTSDFTNIILKNLSFSP